MGQAGDKMRRIAGGYSHWCPACDEMHPLPDSWTFDGNLEKPTFAPSFKHNGLKLTYGPDGKWDGWARDAAGNTIPHICHYHITEGKIAYCNDCNHEFNSKTIPMPDLPDELKDL